MDTFDIRRAGASYTASSAAGGAVVQVDQPASAGYTPLHDVIIENPGPNDIRVRAGADVTADAASAIVPAGFARLCHKGGATHLALYSPAGNQAVLVTLGAGGLEMVPIKIGGTSGGSGGDATAANQTTEITRLTEIRDKIPTAPATAAKQDSLLDAFGTQNAETAASDAAIAPFMSLFKRLLARINFLIGLLPPTRGVQPAADSLSVTPATGAGMASSANQEATNAGIGAPGDAEVSRGANGSLIAILKGMFQGLGASNDNAATAGGTGSLTAKLRLLTSMFPVSLGAKAASASLSVTPATDAVHSTIGFADNPTDVFTRPADTTAYAVGGLVANSTTAGSVVPMTLTVARVAAGSFMLRRLKLAKSGSSITGASFRVHLFASAPTLTNGDNGVYLPSNVAGYLGAFDVTMDRVFSDGACGFGVPLVGGDMIKLAAGQTIRAVIEARGAYTPANAETFRVTLDDLQN